MKIIKKISLVAMLLGTINCARADESDPQDELNYKWLENNTDTNYVYKTREYKRTDPDNNVSANTKDTKITRDLFGRIVERKEILTKKEGNQIIIFEKIWTPTKYTTLLTGRNAAIAGTAFGAAAIGGGLYASGLLSRQPVNPVVEVPADLAPVEQPAPAEQVATGNIAAAEQAVEQEQPAPAEQVAEQPAQPRSWRQYAQDTVAGGLGYTRREVISAVKTGKSMGYDFVDKIIMNNNPDIEQVEPDRESSWYQEPGKGKDKEDAKVWNYFSGNRDNSSRLSSPDATNPLRVVSTDAAPNTLDSLRVPSDTDKESDAASGSESGSDTPRADSPTVPSHTDSPSSPTGAGAGTGTGSRKFNFGGFNVGF